MKKLTIIDIARMAGVGKSTVSRVINGDPGVKRATKEKVLKVIEEVNFIPSRSAQSMRLKQNKVIGIINTRLGSRSENKTIKGILEVLYKNNYDVIILESDFSREKTVEHMDVLREKNIAGVIIFAISGMDYAFLEKMDIPVVMVAKEVENFTSIAYDDYSAIKSVMGYLEEEGRSRIAYIGVDHRDITTGYIRYSAYRDWCKTNKQKDISRFGDFSYESGYRLAKEIFEAERDIEAVVCATDNIALGVRKFLTEGAMENIVVTGIGNDKLLKFLYEDHISINFRYDEAGRKAARSIVKKIQGEEVENTLIEGELVKL
ncbi:trehalose operon repressor [Propionigenium maris DSM 9537]|uniref:Trehalose operon repressor n=1 Tax=Propionigenium maris DSM 9537 TaxID=1123000 RepID=A0A9W6LLZ1_9FUSO|nr:LacI family DNA-binding transcriptional regulator [Propionigenium maris]GLI55234.1 trehalose operon repressor [Propionigenium maris DSM 9537]